jgi:CheY-like chemotaxis protein
MSETRAPRPSRGLQYQLAGVGEGDGLLVQVVDDDADMIKLIRAILGGSGYRTSAAFDAMQGMIIATRDGPAVIIIDLHMPAGGGLSLIRKLRAAPKTARTPLLVLTGDTSEGLREQVGALGAEEFLLKPFQPEELLDAVGRLVWKGG